MRKLLSLAIALGAASPSAAGAVDPPGVQVMVLGTYHMGNPGRDLANLKADDVTQPKRQREIAAVTAEIARWKPTKVFVESQVPAPFTVARYRQFKPSDLATNPNETWQIAFRLAHALGHADVYGFDEQPGEAEPEYFQFGRVQQFAQANGKGPLVASTMAYFQQHVKQIEESQRTKSIAELLIDQNDPVALRRDHGRGYYFALPIGNADQQVGAEYNSYWYMRNAKMFGKIALIAEPGDRLLVLVGSGHAYWLRHFASETPGYRLVDPGPFLRRAARRR